jgi:Transposase
MRTSRFTDEQIIGIVREYEAGAKLTELCWRHNVSPTTFYKWRAKYGGMAVSRIEALGHDPRLLFGRPAAPATDPGNDLEPAEAVGARTIRTTMITHRSRPDPISSGPSSSCVSAGSQGARRTTVTAHQAPTAWLQAHT